MTVLTSSAIQTNCFEGNTANYKTTIEGTRQTQTPNRSTVIARRSRTKKPYQAQPSSGFAEANSSSQHNPTKNDLAITKTFLSKIPCLQQIASVKFACTA